MRTEPHLGSTATEMFIPHATFYFLIVVCKNYSLYIKINIRGNKDHLPHLPHNITIFMELLASPLIACALDQEQIQYNMSDGVRTLEPY